MAPTDKTGYSLRIIGTATAVIVGAVAIGFIPRCDSYQTKALAREQHERLMLDCTASNAKVVDMLEDLSRSVRKALRKRGDPHE